MKGLMLGAIGAIVAFEIAVVAMMLAPQVEAQYRAVFIDRSSDCWPHPVSGVIEPNQMVSFFTTEADSPATHVLRCGWLAPEATGTWSLGTEARLLLSLPPGRQSTLDLDLVPFGERQRVGVTIAGQPVADWTLTPDGTRQYSVALPAIAEGTVEIAFHFPDAVSPRDLGLSNDRRKFAIRLLTATLRPH